MDEQQFRQEYPSTWEDALSGGGDFVFRSKDVDYAAVYAHGCSPTAAAHEPRCGWAPRSRKYIKAWDIGRHQDAAVGIALDVTDGVVEVVAYQRLREQTYPTIQWHIEQMHAAWPGLTIIEDNAAGAAVRENLNIKQEQVRGFTMTATSKAKIIQQLNLQLQLHQLKWNPAQCPQLDAEMRGYQLPDDNVVQDSVMALAIALEHAPQAYLPRKRIPILYF